MNRLTGWARARTLVITAVLVLAAPASARAAYDLTVSTNPTTNVTCGSGTCTATGVPANLNTSELETALGTGNVAIETGTGGTQAGDITVQSPIDTSSSSTLAFLPQGAVVIDQPITTAGNQIYNTPVTLGSSTTITTGINSFATFASTVDGMFDLTVAGGAQFDGPVGSTTPLNSLTVTGPSTLAASVFTTSGAQNYQGAVTLAASTTINPGGGSSATFASSVDGAFGLSVSGAARFDGAVGSGAPLSSLVVSGTATLAGGTLTTNGTQFYGDAVTLAADTTINASTVAFASTVDGSHALMIGGAATFGAAVGDTTALTSLAVTGPASLGGGDLTTTGAQTYDGAVTLAANTAVTARDVDFASTVDGTHALTIGGSAMFGGAVGGTYALASLLANGPATLAGGNVETSGAQTYEGAVTLGSSTTITPGLNSLVQFDSTVDGAFDLTVAGSVRFNGAVGGATALASLLVNGPATLAGGSVETAGAQVYNAQVTLAAATSIGAMNTASITFAATVDGAFDLTVEGSVQFAGAVGGATALASLLVNGAATLAGGSVATTGAQTYNDQVTLAAATAITAGDVEFASTVDGTHALTIGASVTFGGVVGGTQALTSLVVTGPATLAGGSIMTSGAQTYDGAVALVGPVSLTASTSADISFGATVDGGAGLTILTQGGVRFAGAVGSVTPVGALDIGSASGPIPQSIDFGGDVSVETANLNGPVVLSADDTVSVAASGSFTFDYSVTGNHTLIAAGPGIIYLAGSGDSYGSTIVAGGTLAFSNGGLGPGPVTLDGGTLEWWAQSPPLDDPSVHGLAVTSKGGTLLTNGASVTLANAVGGTGTLTTNTGSGTLTLAGTGSYGGAIDERSGTIDLTGSIDTPIMVASGATLNVPSGGATSGAVEVAGALNCNSGTITGVVTNNGGTLQGAPGAPTVTGVAPGTGLATVSFTPGPTNCYPVTYRAAASPGGATSGAAGGSPLTVSGLTFGIPYTFAVTAANAVGSSASAPFTPNSFSVLAAAPSASISAPVDGAIYAVGQTVTADYSCQDGVGGPGIGSCSGPVASGGAIDTSVPGVHSFTVMVNSADGQSATTTVHYVVAAAPSVTIAGPLAGAIYQLGRVVTATYSCQDGVGGPGIKSCGGTAASGAALDTSTVGSHSFTVTATSGDGQATTTAVTYTVAEAPLKLISRPRVTPRGVVELSLLAPYVGTVRVTESGRRARTLTRTLRITAPRTLHLKLRWLRPRRGARALRAIRVRIVYAPVGGRRETKVLTVRRR